MTNSSWKKPLQTQSFLPYIMATVPAKKMGIILSDGKKTRLCCQPGHFDDVDLVEALHEKGYQVIVIDWNVITLENALELAQWASFIIPRSCWDYVDNVERFCAIMGIFSHHGNLLNPWKFGLSNTSKGMYLRQAERHGLPVTPTVWLDPNTVPDWERYFAKFGTTLFLKPQRGAGAKGCMEVTYSTIPDANALIAEYFNEDIGMMIQPCFHFTEPERKLIFIGGRFSHAITQKDLVATTLDKVIEYQPSAKELELGYRVVEHVCKVAGISPSELLFLRVDIFPDGSIVEFCTIEDQAYFRKAPGSVDKFAEAILRLLNPKRKTEEPIVERHTEPLEKSKLGILNMLYAMIKIPFLLLRS